MICPNCALAADTKDFSLHSQCRDLYREGCNCAHRESLPLASEYETFQVVYESEENGRK